MIGDGTQTFFVTVASGLESVLEAELRQLGLADLKAVGAGVYVTGPLEAAYRVCLWSRVATRVLLPLATFPAGSPEQLYREVGKINWSKHMDVHDTLAVDFFSANSAITHTRYGALKVKDAIVDQFRDLCGERPSVARDTPSLRINVYVFRDKARLALDLAGQSLHRRGYRQDASTAPLKENLAAALLYAMDWPAMAARGASFCDPMCGSGTLSIEAGLMAADIAPQATRDYFGFLGWKGHQPAVWEKLQAEASARKRAGFQALQSRLIGADISGRAIHNAKDNCARAGLGDVLELHAADVAVAQYAKDVPVGLVLSNPPYGVRLENTGGLGKLYTTLGRALKTHFAGWTVGIFSGSADLVHRMRLPSKAVLRCANGGIDCRLMQMAVPADAPSAPRQRGEAGSETDAQAGAAMFANRLRKNVKALKKWAAAEGVGCYRVYDADLPEYAVAVDIYESDRRYVQVQEYRAPARIDKDVAQARLNALLGEIPAVLGCDADAIRLRQRQRQPGAQQYEKLQNFHDAGQDTHIIEENGCRFEVNLSDYLDTGIFADHRKIRRWIAREAPGKRFLNLFAYTGTATVQAAVAGATSTTTVDLSNNYLAWAERNLALNVPNPPPEHSFVRADCLAWLREQTERGCYDLILLDPPTFSNSKAMDQDWDVQRDHVAVIRQAMRLLSAEGLLIFSNNFRQFRLDAKKLDRYRIENRTRDSIPRDFARSAHIHQCYFMRHLQ